jgi:hypothetical protein
MKFRLPMSGPVVLLVVLFALSGHVALAGDGKGHDGDHGQTQSSNDQGDDHDHGQSGDDQGDNQQSGTSTNAGDGSGDDKAHEANETPQKEQEEARQAVANGKAAPLTVLLKKLKADYPGQILDVALVKDAVKLRFIVKYIDKANQIKTVTLDALTLEDD